MKIPETKQEWERLKKLFLKKYKVEDSPETWTFILSQLQNVKMPELQFKPETIFAYYKRWKIAKVLQDEKTVYIQALNDKLKEKMEALSKEAELSGAPSQAEHTEHNDLQTGTFYSEGDLPPLPDSSEGVVSSP